MRGSRWRASGSVSARGIEDCSLALSLCIFALDFVVDYAPFEYMLYTCLHSVIFACCPATNLHSSCGGCTWRLGQKARLRTRELLAVSCERHLCVGNAESLGGASPRHADTLLGTKGRQRNSRLRAEEAGGGYRFRWLVYLAKSTLGFRLRRHGKQNGTCSLVSL